ncbi:MAG: aminoacyl-histidine dipeptidase [Gemmatimonadetes bacterium]|nr:aminoacyl-histidine dipeptidase [Gemmatimonadota bacterium]
MSSVETLEPTAVWRYFDRIQTFPRGAGDEGRIRDYIIEVARAHGLASHVDAVGNVVVRVPATPGREAAPAIILQGHLDMVNEKDSDVAHDFDRDAIQPRLEGEYLTATGTTLGSDNGIGVASMLALLDSPAAVHGPLELLFTIDEETGLTGAGGLDQSLLAGRRLINLDSEEEDAVTVGCAGGADVSLRLPLAPQAVSGGRALAVQLRGMKGGHSGVDIHLQRGNAVKLLARILHSAVHEHAFRIAPFGGGNKHNASPREAGAVLVAAGDVVALRTALQSECAAVRAEYAVADGGMTAEVSDVALPAEAWTAETTVQVLHLLEALPHGVLAMSLDIPGLVETSTNVATVAVKDGRLVIGNSCRSSVMPALRAVQRRLKAIGHLAHAEIDERHGYPGWKPDLASPLLEVVRAAYTRVHGREPAIRAVHAGLECGIIGEKIPGMDMISIGPQIEFPHSPAERVRVPSVAGFWALLQETLARLS